MSTKHNKTAPRTADEDLTLEQRVKRLEKRAMEHGWDLDAPPSDPSDPEQTAY